MFFDWDRLQLKELELKSTFIKDNAASHSARLTIAHVVKKKKKMISKTME